MELMEKYICFLTWSLISMLFLEVCLLFIDLIFPFRAGNDKSPKVPYYSHQAITSSTKLEFVPGQLWTIIWTGTCTDTNFWLNNKT